MTRGASFVFDERLSFPLGYWNAFGALAAVGAVLALGLAADVRAPAHVRGLCAAAVPLLAVALHLSLSRGAWLALACGVAALLVLAPRRTSVILSALVVGARRRAGDRAPAGPAAAARRNAGRRRRRSAAGGRAAVAVRARGLRAGAAERLGLVSEALAARRRRARSWSPRRRAAQRSRSAAPRGSSGSTTPSVRPRRCRPSAARARLLSAGGLRSEAYGGGARRLPGAAAAR